MKNLYIISSVLVCIIILFQPCQIKAQSPSKMSYQSVIRNSNDVLISNTQVGMRVQILQGSQFGAAIYVETHLPTTNNNGLASLEVGNGTVVLGNFSTINWLDGPYFLKTEIDPAGGSNYSISGTSELLSVPYALSAKDCETSSLINTTVINANCPTSISLTDVYSKIADIGTFTKTVAGSVIDATFNGRIRVATITSNGAVFELRIDDNPTTNGRARALIKSAEAGSDGIAASLTGLFTGLSAGSHTVSLWARASNGTATGAMWDPGCWSTDVVVVKEFK